MKPYIYTKITFLLLLVLSLGQPANAQTKAGNAGLTLAQTSVNNTALSAAINKAGLLPLLSNTGPYTFFVPSDAALQQLSQKSAEATREILLGHIVEGRFTEADLHDGRTLTSMSRHTLKVFRKKGQVMINGRKITSPNQSASNGIIHTVDNLLVRDMQPISSL